MATTVSQVEISKGEILVSWSSLVTNDAGDKASITGYPDRTVQVTGTFGGGSVTIQGSNDGTNWATMTDNIGDDLTFSAAGMALIAENPRYVRPLCASMTSAAVTICGKQ